MNFRKELQELLNKYSMETKSNTPDFILAEFLIGCLLSFEQAVNSRQAWYKPNKEALPDSADELRSEAVDAGADDHTKELSTED